MKSIRIINSIIIIVVLTSIVFAQQVQYDTHKIELNGELSIDDPFEENFGRFDAYEINLEEGDYIKINLVAQFFPLLSVVSPSGNYQLAFPSDGSSEVIFEQVTNETGRWYLYVSGDSSDIGTHNLDIYYVSQNTKMLQPNSNICETTKFLLAHANTNFFYLRDREISFKNDNSYINLQNQNSFQEVKIETEGEKVNAELKANSVDKSKFKKWSYELSECLQYEWQEKGSDNQTQFLEVNGTRGILLNYNGNSILLSISDLINKN